MVPSGAPPLSHPSGDADAESEGLGLRNLVKKSRDADDWCSGNEVILSDVDGDTRCRLNGPGLVENCACIESAMTCCRAYHISIFRRSICNRNNSVRSQWSQTTLRSSVRVLTLSTGV